MLFTICSLPSSFWIGPMLLEISPPISTLRSTSFSPSFRVNNERLTDRVQMTKILKQPGHFQSAKFTKLDRQHRRDQGIEVPGYEAPFL
jgi:hypothetical protein